MDSLSLAPPTRLAPFFTPEAGDRGYLGVCRHRTGISSLTVAEIDRYALLVKPHRGQLVMPTSIPRPSCCAWVMAEITPPQGTRGWFGLVTVRWRSSIPSHTAKVPGGTLSDLTQVSRCICMFSPRPDMAPRSRNLLSGSLGTGPLVGNATYSQHRPGDNQSDRRQRPSMQAVSLSVDRKPDPLHSPSST
ncbi:hypothetical protein LZ30DRAFT_216044 [Colletotrichum cereale]|nr:hypothetical protein LZ30DRAFT_216044 [Colletotrichum cereale]